MEPTPPAYQVLYVSDIDHISREENLWQAFAPWAHGIRSIRLIRDINKPFALTHAYINFTNHNDAKDALENVQPLIINSSYCRVVPYDGVTLVRPARFDQNGGSGVFIKNLDMQVSATMLWSLFMRFGNIVGCRIAIDEFGIPRGFAYVTYETPEQASAAIEAMDGQLIGRRRVSASRNLPKNQRATRIFIKFQQSSQPLNIEDAKIQESLEALGPLDSVSVPRDHEGRMKGFAFATFREHNDAMKAYKELEEVAGVPVTVDLATGSSQRFLTPTHDPNNSTPGASSGMNGSLLTDHSSSSSSLIGSGMATGVPPAGIGGGSRAGWKHGAGPIGFQGLIPNGTKQPTSNTNLFVRPLSSEVREKELQEEFGKFGTITSTKVMVDPEGNSRRFGFVSFDSVESANKAVEELNGAERWGQQLFVAPAQSRRKSHHMRMGLHPSQHIAGHRGLSSPMAPAYPGLYYIPMEYAYDYSPYTAATAYSPGLANPGSMMPVPPMPVPLSNTRLDGASMEELGEMLHPHVVQHSAIGGDLDLASKITGILLQQSRQDIISWLENPVLLDLRIQQGYDAFRDWSQQAQKGQ